MNNYHEYLLSDHWKKLTEETKRLAGYRCQVCNADGELHTHHRTYERRGDEFQGDLVALCANCHALFHNKIKGPDTISLKMYDNDVVVFQSLDDMGTISARMLVLANTKDYKQKEPMPKVCLSINDTSTIWFENIIKFSEWAVGKYDVFAKEVPR